jgi:2-keto-4-pentenoate hydratase/2-oxohepta-3-ene-1,7-dioic acid hydratase in catechol pathway
MTDMDKLICVGKNYLEHAKELGDAVPEKPVFFMKPASIARTVGALTEEVRLSLPTDRGAIHYECEIILQLDEGARIRAVSLGLDLTLRDVQAELKKKGHPWEVSKVFRDSAVIGTWISVVDFPNYLDVEFQFRLDGSIRQRGFGRDMRFSPDQCLTFAQGYFPIRAGDVLFTGTPAGVGPVQPGQIGELFWGERLCARVTF